MPCIRHGGYRTITTRFFKLEPFRPEDHADLIVIFDPDFHDLGRQRSQGAVHATFTLKRCSIRFAQKLLLKPRSIMQVPVCSSFQDYSCTLTRQLMMCWPLLDSSWRHKQLAVRIVPLQAIRWDLFAVTGARSTTTYPNRAYGCKSYARFTFSDPPKTVRQHHVKEESL